MIVPYGHVLLLAGILFVLGLVCAVARRNLVMVLLGVEIMLNAAESPLSGRLSAGNSWKGRCLSFSS